MNDPVCTESTVELQLDPLDPSKPGQGVLYDLGCMTCVVV